MPYSESVYLDCVTPDGAVGFVSRLALHPDEGCSWLWLHIFLGERAYGFNRQDLPAAPPASGTGSYGLPGWARFDAGQHARVEVEVPASDGASVAPGDGPHRVRLDATFEATAAAGSNLPGRTERLGVVEATVTIDGTPHRIAGRGQLHEQHQDAPRFTRPFTYCTLRGDDTGGVFLIGPQRSGGFITGPGPDGPVAEVAIEAPSDERAIRLTRPDGRVVAGALHRMWHYELPINGHARTSSIVRGEIGGMAVSGCVNDWLPPTT